LLNSTTDAARAMAAMRGRYAMSAGLIAMLQGPEQDSLLERTDILTLLSQARSFELLNRG